MNRREIMIDLGMRIAFMAAVYGVFAMMLPSYRTVTGVAALLDGAVLIGIVTGAFVISVVSTILNWLVVDRRTARR